MWGAVAVSGQRPKTRHRTASYTRHRIAWPWMSTVPVLQSPGLGHRSVWVLDKAHCEEHGFGARHPGPWCTSVTLDESVLMSLDSSAVKMGRSDRSSMRDPLRGLRAHRKDSASASPRLSPSASACRDALCHPREPLEGILHPGAPARERVFLRLVRRQLPSRAICDRQSYR